MNELALVQKGWNYAHVLRDQGVPYQAYIYQICISCPSKWTTSERGCCLWHQERLNDPRGLPLASVARPKARS